MIGIAVIGIGGYGQCHLDSVRYCENSGLCRLKAVVVIDPDADRKELDILLSRYPELRVYPDFDSLLLKEKEVSLVSIPTGITSHMNYSIKAMEAGYDVICEKPAAGTSEDVLKMAEVQQKTKRILAIGFQNIFSESIQRIKQIALSGDLGKLKHLSSMVLWKRDSFYYSRNKWAGKIYDGNSFIFDSPLQNAAAHYLQNLLFVAGPSQNETAVPLTVYGENYRAKNIESADTQYIRMELPGGAVITMAATHATESHEIPLCRFIFEKGSIEWSDNNGKTIVKDREGSIIEEFENELPDSKIKVFINTIDAIQKKQEPLCHIHNSASHTASLNCLYHSMKDIHTVPEEFCKKTNRESPAGAFNIYIDCIDDAVRKSFHDGSSFFEQNLPWAREGEIIDACTYAAALPCRN